ncbi:restriction endonuclease subunit S [uncultured Megasphaera sp.]|uniref:restriction endonuclease subunit S n=1 Tax=uncultured Megasphaera sp. TaxID=165188 RepID=UPI002673DC23|nr:restriction endonuclease subunit S [uncultured Megasphaera sp.]
MTKNLHIDTQAMRAKILDLAIQGKLTDQRAEDGNAQDLLKEIQVEKEKLIKEKKIKKEKPLPEITEAEKPFEIPKNWMWARWGTLSISIKYGYNTSAQKDGKIKMVRISDIQNNQVSWDSVPFCNIPKEEITQYLLRKNDILFARTGGTVGKSYLVSEVPENVVYAGYLIRTRYSENLSPQYLKYFMESDLYWSQLKKGTTTTAQPNCNAKTLGKMVLPLPPLAEQKRIADKVSALFAQLDAIDKAYEEYRELQQTMKTKLLDLAIQGKLTAQRAEDGDARDLLKEIQAEKEKLIKEKKIKKEKPLLEITEEEKPFDIPENWMWVRLGEMILNHIGGGTPDKSNEAYWNGDIPWMSVKDVHQDSMYADRTIDSITPAGLENSSSNLIEANRLIVVMRMAVGRAVINKLPVAINQDLRALFFRDNVTQEYILRIFKILKFETSGMTVKGIKLWVLLNTPIPLPPLAEQKRIVAKLDELLPLL